MLRVQIDASEPREVKGIDQFDGEPVCLVPTMFVLVAPAGTEWGFGDGLRAVNLTEKVFAYVSPEVLTETERERLIHGIGREVARYQRTVQNAFQVLDGRAPAGVVRRA